MLACQHLGRARLAPVLQQPRASRMQSHRRKSRPGKWPQRLRIIVRGRSQRCIVAACSVKLYPIAFCAMERTTPHIVSDRGASLANCVPVMARLGRRAAIQRQSTSDCDADCGGTAHRRL